MKKNLILLMNCVILLPVGGADTASNTDIAERE